MLSAYGRSIIVALVIAITGSVSTHADDEATKICQLARRLYDENTDLI